MPTLPHETQPSDIPRLQVKTGLRAGETPNLFESAYFALLDVLQKPTDWLYDLISPSDSSENKH